jgi:hypothetical protein
MLQGWIGLIIEIFFNRCKYLILYVCMPYMVQKANIGVIQEYVSGMDWSDNRNLF